MFWADYISWLGKLEAMPDRWNGECHLVASRVALYRVMTEPDNKIFLACKARMICAGRTVGSFRASIKSLPSASPSSAMIWSMRLL